MSDLFSLEETQKRRIKDLNCELLHVRNLAEKFRQENKQAQKEIAQFTEMNQRYKGKMQEQQDQIAELKAEKVEIENLLNIWKSFVQEQEFCTKPHKETHRIRAMATALEKALRGEHE